MNIGQILETHLGWAAARLDDGGRRLEHGRRFISTPVFDGATPSRSTTRSCSYQERTSTTASA